MDVDFVRKFIPVALSDDYNYDKSSQNTQLLCLYTIYRDSDCPKTKRGWTVLKS